MPAVPTDRTVGAPSGGVIAGGRFLLPPDPELVTRESAFPSTTICSMPTVEGFSQYVHPKVLDFGAGGWNGWRYWMANTNYPGTNDAVENPAIFVSSDGTAWQSIGTNPVIPRPDGATLGVLYNSDPHLLFHNETLYLYYRVYNAVGNSLSNPREQLRVASSTDGVSWSSPTIVLNVHEDWDAGLLAPCVSHLDGVFYLWSFRNRTSPTTLVLRKASNPLGPFSALQTATFTMPLTAGTRQPWHGDIVKTRGGWAMLFCDRTSPAQLWFAYGKKNGLDWTIKSDPITTGSPDQYRPSLVLNGDGYDCWISNYGSPPRTTARIRLTDNQLD